MSHMKLILIALVVAACNTADTPQDPKLQRTGDRVLELCGPVPTIEPAGDYHDWAAIIEDDYHHRYAYLYEINWTWMVDYADQMQAWTACASELD